MSIVISFITEGRPPAWDVSDVAKLQAAVEALEYRLDLDMDRPDERHRIRHALDALLPVLAVANGEKAEPVAATKTDCAFSNDPSSGASANCRSRMQTAIA
jgi:hypothetical protein